MKNLDNQKLTGSSQKLRKNMTPEERHLWYDFLKTLPFTINRQKVIGNYIVDFFCFEKKTVIEIDGMQHGSTKIYESDQIRDAYMKRQGFQVLRYSNAQIRDDFDGVCKDIMKTFEL